MDVLVKSHAAAARVAAAIDGMLALRQQHGFAADDIETIRLGIPRVIAGRLTNAHPVDLQAAQMCLPFSVALASKIPVAADLVPAVAVRTMRRRSPTAACSSSRTAPRSTSTTRSRPRAMNAPPPRG